jgi:hypothetical protein
MQAGGDILVVQKEGEKPFFSDALVAADATVHVLAAAKTNFTVYVQKLTVFIVTHASGKKITFQSSAGSPVVLGNITDQTAGAGVPDHHVIDFGPHGIALAADVGLNVLSESSGVTANVHAEGYYKLSAVINTGTVSTQN